MSPILCAFWHHYELGMHDGRCFVYCTHCGDMLPLELYNKEKKEGKE